MSPYNLYNIIELSRKELRMRKKKVAAGEDEKKDKKRKEQKELRDILKENRDKIPNSASYVCIAPLTYYNTSNIIHIFRVCKIRPNIV